MDKTKNIVTLLIYNTNDTWYWKGGLIVFMADNFHIQGDSIQKIPGQKETEKRVSTTDPKIFTNIISGMVNPGSTATLSKAATSAPSTTFSSVLNDVSKPKVDLGATSTSSTTNISNKSTIPVINSVISLPGITSGNSIVSGGINTIATGSITAGAVLPVVNLSNITTQNILGKNLTGNNVFSGIQTFTPTIKPLEYYQPQFDFYFPALEFDYNFNFNLTKLDKNIENLVKGLDIAKTNKEPVRTVETPVKTDTNPIVTDYAKQLLDNKITQQVPGLSSKLARAEAASRPEATSNTSKGEQKPNVVKADDKMAEGKKQIEKSLIKVTSELVFKDMKGNILNVKDVLLKAFANKVQPKNEITKIDSETKSEEAANKITDNKLNQIKENQAKAKDIINRKLDEDTNVLANTTVILKKKEEERKSQTEILKEEGKLEEGKIKKVEGRNPDEEAQKFQRGMK